ncbi:GAF domain-containing protein [Pinibacter soli]|uniref:GAF domain-containing protein n=1 Tax=Pinibacter soli TaxID=3044211 RepID=A0ABT6RG44_9BACT|nr:GAF domain-containing protein [Pinibacter soli]MDI3321345.1 GAF domain-containing protein [Pinibacter soli]
MQNTIINVFPDLPPDSTVEIALSFGPFIRFLKSRNDKDNMHKNHFFKYIIDQFERHPELLSPIDVKEMYKYSKQLELVYAAVSPVVADEESHYWALCTPGVPSLFFSTNAFFNLITNKDAKGVINNAITKGNEDLQKGLAEMSYSLILEMFYDIPSFFNQEMIKQLDDKETGLAKYYKINPDTRFTDIVPLKPLPQLDMTLFQSRQTDKDEILARLHELMPLNMFRFEGFGITNAEDVTSSYALDTIKNLLLSHSDDESENYAKITNALKTLIGSKDIEFGALPFLQINNKLVFKDKVCTNSMLVRSTKDFVHMETAYAALTEKYFKNPRIVFYNEISEDDTEKENYLKCMKLAGVRSFAFIPVFFNNLLVGMLEVFCKKEGVFTEGLLSRLDPAIPLISQLMKNTIDEFGNGLNKVIKERFTAIQPSVQWKFNEVAWHHMRDVSQQVPDPEIEDIVFENVYPLYGAVDIRNSTIERNAALYKDMQVQFNILVKVLQELKKRSGFGLIDEKIFVTQQWIQKIAAVSEFNEEVKLNDFLENDITPFLINFTESNPAYRNVTDEYFSAIDEKAGKAYHNRRQLERSMNTVISSLNNYFELLKIEIQQAYPCYFEKFRTDGVEYDIYIGQSITPDKPYNDMYLSNLRLMQLTSMVTVAKYSHSLLPHIPRQVETTQLIFIHSHPIDIRFRKDEKRFDVEGAYNIRYHIIKKRIDKVHVRDTGERLTQPNKIALIYFNQKEADEYISYIKYLQGEKMLMDDLEYLDLEDLQGVSGLKALRVGVMVD